MEIDILGLDGPVPLSVNQSGKVRVTFNAEDWAMVRLIVREEVAALKRSLLPIGDIKMKDEQEPPA